MPKYVVTFIIALAAATASSFISAQESRPAAIILGKGDHAFEWTRGFGIRPDKTKLGNTHGMIAFDAAGLCYFNTDTADAIMVYERDGKFVRSIAPEWAGGAHGMVIRKEGDAEYIYLAHHSRHECAKLTLDGKVVVTFAWPEASGKYSKKDEYHPTSIAVAPNGEVFCADGYGKSFIHQYSAKGEYMQTFGGPGGENGKMHTPHGLFIDTRPKSPVLVVADRENGRLQLFDLNGKFLREVKGDLRRPCNMDTFGNLMAVADLAGRVTLLDENYKLVDQIGDNPDQAKWANNGVPSKDWQDGCFIAPHGIQFDRDGNLYVMDWVAEGRVTKLKKVPAAK